MADRNRGDCRPNNGWLSDDLECGKGDDPSCYYHLWQQAQADIEALADGLQHWVDAYSPDIVVYPRKRRYRQFNETPEFRVGRNAMMQIIHDRIGEALAAHGQAGKALLEELERLRGNLTLDRLQEELRPWQEHNFPGRESWEPLLGIQEEVGELSHAHLKEHQNIRGTAEEHLAEAQDAVADIVVFLADYCNARGWNFQRLLEETWAEVRQRDWQQARAALEPQEASDG